VLERLPFWVRGLPVPVRYTDGLLRRGTIDLRHLAYLWTRYIPAVREECRQVCAVYQGGDMIDVGAYHGWYSMLLAPKAASGATFLSLEPDPAAFPTLQRNMSSLRRAFPHVRFVALSEAAGDGETPRRVVTPGHPSFRGGRTMDEIVRAVGVRPELVKVDVEGAEWYVLEGMVDTLKRRPTVMLELHPLWQPEGVTVDSVLGLLDGYSTVDIGTDGATSHVLATARAMV
jgi:FkbM family methyltransferase